MKRIKSTIDMMNLVAANRITETGNFPNQFVFSTGFDNQNLERNPLSRLSREQLAAFLNAESCNARSAHFSVPPAEPTLPTPEKGLAVGVLKQAAYDLRRFRTATKGADREHDPFLVYSITSFNSGGGWKEFLLKASLQNT